MTIYEQALKYLSLKWSVIPLKPNSKEPLIPWQEYQKRLPTQDELKKWFQETQNNLGIVTGSVSNLSVLDVDDMKSLINQQVSSPITVATKRGRHLYFSFSGEANSASKIAEHIDVRGEGGYVVAPESIVDGFKYRFSNPYFHINQLTPFPIGLVPTKTENTKTGLKRTGKIGELLENLKEGNRDSTFVSLIGLLHNDGYAGNDILAFLAPHAERVGFHELQSKIEHILVSYPNNKSVVVEQDNDNFSDFLNDIKPVEWISEPVLGKGTITFVAGLPKTMKTWVCADLAIEVARGGMWLGKFPVHPGKVLFIDQERWKGEVQRRFLAMIKAKNITKEDLDGKLILKSGTTTRLDLEESFQAFRKRLLEIKPDLLIIDSFVTFHTRQENDRQSITPVLERLKQIRQEIGCSIVIIDHEGKGAFQEAEEGKEVHYGTMAGSVAKPAAAETVLTIRRKGENESIMYHTASNLGPTIQPVTLILKDIDGGILIHG